MLDSVFGLIVAGDCTSLFARMGFPPASLTARAEISVETDDVVEGPMLSAGVKIGSGWSYRVGKPNFAVNVNVEPSPGTALPSILPP